MSTYPEHDELSATIERIARHIGDDQPLAHEALHMVAQLLRNDARAAHERLAQMLQLVDVSDLLSAAKKKLELETYSGDAEARHAAQYIASARGILYPSGEVP